MAKTRRLELRVLNADEMELVDASRHPHVMNLSDEDLRSLRGQLRTRRDRARDLANRRRREMRGKAVGSGNLSTQDSGIREKLAALSAAVQRTNQENSRRERFSAREELKRNAEKALEMRRAASRPNRPHSKRARKGMRPIPNQRAEDLVNRMELGRVSQFVKNSQARKDAR